MNVHDLNLHIKPSEEACILRTGDAPKIYIYEGYQHKVDTTESFCRLLKDKAKDVSQAVVFVHKEGYTSIVDTSIKDRPQDTIEFKYSQSVLAKEWWNIFVNGAVFDIKSMVDFLKRREDGEIDNVDVFMHSVKNFKYVIHTSGDFTRDDAQNYVMAIKIAEAEGTIKVPDHIIANVELLEGSGFVQAMEIEVDIHRPKSDQEGKPGFRLSCPKYDRYLDKAKRQEIASLENNLQGFLIVKGKP